MITSTKKDIVQYINKYGRVRAHDLIRRFNISNVAIHKQLNRLISEDILSKIGKPPLVFYVINVGHRVKNIIITTEIKEKINNDYLYISPLGEIVAGFNGFEAWTRSTRQDNVKDLASEYVKVRKIADSYFNLFNWIEATDKLKQTFENIFINKLIYQDFYSLPKFGKTKLGQLVLYAKQSQNLKLINKIAKITKPIIRKIINKYRIDTLAFIPATIPRKIQFIKEFQHYLDFSMPTITFNKIYKGEVIVAQKTLVRLDERIINARETIEPKEKHIATNLLLIDDAVGSGATLNETARKLRQQKIVKNKIIGYSIVGSYKGFDVIREI